MSKRAIVTAIAAALIAAAMSLGYINEATGAIMSGLVISWVGADTLRPSGTTGTMGGNGPIPPK